MKKRERIPWGQLLVFFFIGLGLSFLLAAIFQSDLMGQWVPLNPPPEKVSELITISGLYDLSPDLIISDKDGNQFECITPKTGCYEWQLKPTEMRAPRQAENFSCNFQHPRFTFFARPFQKVEQCLEILFDAGGHGTTRYVFVLDDRKNLWVGVYPESDDVFLPWFLFFLPISMLASFSIGLVWNFLSSRIGKNRKERK